MKAEFRKSALGKIKTELLCVFMMEKEKPQKELAIFAKDMKLHKYEGKTGQYYHTCTLGKAGFAHLLVVGLGKRKDFNLDALRKAAGTAVQHAAFLKQKNLVIHAPSIKGFDGKKIAQAITEGALLSAYNFVHYKTEKEDIFDVEKVIVTSERHLSEGVRIGSIYADAQNYAREVDEHPANFATPTQIAKEAKKLAKEMLFL